MRRPPSTGNGSAGERPRRGRPRISDGARHAIVAAFFFTLLAPGPRALADYPIVSHRYLADPGALVYNGTVYLYDSNDDDNPVAGGYEMKSIVCVSSSDLKNWTDHGEVFRVPMDATWAGNSWAPAAVARNGKIYLYFGNNASGVGVASSATPLGPFADAAGKALVNASTPGASGTSSWLFDPSVFVDDDGQAYLTFGGNGANNARIIKLNSDMISVSGSAIALTAQNFFEASWLYKRNGLYYFTYSNNPSSGQDIDYMTSSSPTSGYTYRGHVAGQPPLNSNNNHHADFPFNGTWYLSYHNRAVAMQAGISPTYRRNLGIEQLNFNADGTIQQVTYTTDGVTQIGNLNPYVRVEAETINAQSGIETETCSEGGMDVFNIQNGDWIRVRGVDFGAGAVGFSARVASAAGGGNIELHLGTLTGTLIGTCAVPVTGSSQTWVSSSCKVTGATGVKDFYLKFTGGSSGTLFSVDYWQFTSADGGGGGANGSGGAGGGGAGGVGGSKDAGIDAVGTGTAGSGGSKGAGGSAGTGSSGAGGHGGTEGGSGGTAGSAGNGTGGAVAGASGSAGQSGANGGTGGTGDSATGAGGAGAGAAGTNSGEGGSGGKAGAPATNGRQSTGCSCAVGSSSASPWMTLLILALVAIRRRRLSPEVTPCDRRRVRVRGPEGEPPSRLSRMK